MERRLILKVTSLLLFLVPGVCRAQSFTKEQQAFPRVREAYDTKWVTLKKELKEKEIDADNFEIFLRAFKMEEKLEVWVRSEGEERFKLFRTYAICRTSGGLGPKCKQGDKQVPEGFYTISAFNPNSNYHLSLGINYPNSCDKYRSGAANPGGDIMIHGNCVTIGCIPLTDSCINEVYVLAVEARDHGQLKIPVHIFPGRLDTEGMILLSHTFRHDQKLIEFWANLKTGFDFFEQQHKLPVITSDGKGAYVFK